MASTPANANGSRRRALRKRVLAEETHCALCDTRVDKTLGYLAGEHGRRCPGEPCGGCVPDPMRGEVDEDMPRARGGSPYDRTNCRLMHRTCNRWKGTDTLREARARLHGASSAKTTVISSIGW